MSGVIPAARSNYSNWELSADRANAARRVLVSAGLPEEKIGRVVGLAGAALFNRAEPRSPINRRISIIVMSQQLTASADGLTAPAAEPASGGEAAPAPAVPAPGNGS
jgi:chemotaxis protein MotB